VEERFCTNPNTLLCRCCGLRHNSVYDAEVTPAEAAAVENWKYNPAADIEHLFPHSDSSSRHYHLLLFQEYYCCSRSHNIIVVDDEVEVT